MKREHVVAEPFIFINTYKVRSGKEDEYRKRFQEVAEVVEAKEPKMLYFGEHVKEDGSEAATVQVHADAANMDFHMQLVEDHIREAMEYLDLSSMSVRIFGSPSDAVLEQMASGGLRGVGDGQPAGGGLQPVRIDRRKVMAEPLFTVTKPTVRSGKLDDLMSFYQSLESIVEAKEPRLIASMLSSMRTGR